MAHPSSTVYNQSSYTGDEAFTVRRDSPENPFGNNFGGGESRYPKYPVTGKLRAFRDAQTAYDCGMWIKAITSRLYGGMADTAAENYCESIGLEITNAAYEGSGAAGGYLVPSPVSQTIIDVREAVGVARQVLKVMPVTAESLSIPKKAGGLTVYAPGEGTAITDSDKSWSQIALMMRKRAVASLLSQELVADSIISVVDDIFSEMGYALAQQEDREAINGNGGDSTYFGVRGLLSSIGAGGVSTAAVSSTWAAITLAEVSAAVGLLPDRYFPYEPSWICSHSFYNQVFQRLGFAAGGATASEVMTGTPNVRSFLGYKCYLTSQMPTATAVSTKCALFGAFDQAGMLGDRGAIRVSRSDDYKFLEDQVVLKATSRYDINIHDHGDASAAGAYVALSTHS